MARSHTLSLKDPLPFFLPGSPINGSMYSLASSYCNDIIAICKRIEIPLPLLRRPFAGLCFTWNHGDQPHVRILALYIQHDPGTPLVCPQSQAGIKRGNAAFYQPANLSRQRQLSRHKVNALGVMQNTLLRDIGFSEITLPMSVASVTGRLSADGQRTL